VIGRVLGREWDSEMSEAESWDLREGSDRGMEIDLRFTVSAN
jgi:hypothetical protein